MPAGTVTLLLTDVEGSTRLWENAPTAMPEAIARHYGILDEAIASHGGMRPVEQGGGDSVVAAFTRARDAVAAALDAQRAVLAEDWPDGAQLRVRMALHTGDAQLRDEGNYFGAAVIRCARLRAVAHGGQVLLSGATAELVADHLPDGADLVNLGVHRLRDLGRAERVFALGHPDLPGGVPPPRSLDELPNNLPIQLTSFVGRGRELVELDELLASTRLLTLAGAGGCGKTRLALQLAADALDHYPGGAWWLELAPLTDPALVESALATMVGVRPLPGQTPVEAAVFHLAAQRALVLLDNCEHVLEPCRQLADALLHGCPDITVVATSREPLGLGGETTWRVPSLSLPPERAPEALQSLGDSDAVRLFIERAVKVRPNFAVTNESAPHVAQICQHLDGIPLAIELRPRACVSCRSSASPRGSPTDSACSPAASGARCLVCRRCARRSTGATSCSTSPNVRCCVGSACSRAASRSTPARRCAQTTSSTATRSSTCSPRSSTSRSYSSRSASH
ncbi:MAG: adenylate/guanylate cyclase domain-containing protein [Actinomycetota bacterium]|nr:adenylate/guanylate cyclase domain-containing protein [Actinomycetota bacterium]